MKFFYTIIFSIIAISSTAQTLTRDYLNTAKHSRGSFERYILNDSTTYTLGDTIKIGMPSAADNQYQYVSMYSFDGVRSFLPVADNFKIVIKVIKVTHTEEYGYQCKLETKFAGTDKAIVLLDQAIDSGEIQKGVLSKDTPSKPQNTPINLSLTPAPAGDKSMILQSGISLQKSKKLKVASLVLALTSGGALYLSADGSQASEGMQGLGLGLLAGSVACSIGSIHHLGRSGAYLQAYANGFIITF